MTKLAHFALLTVLLIAGFNRQKSTADPTAETQYGNKPTLATPAVSGPKETEGKNLQSNARQKQDDDPAKVIIPKPVTIEIPRDNYDKIGLFGNLLVAVVGIVGIVVAVGTLKKIERQTAATERSVTLQETAYKQWVVFQDWTSNLGQDQKSIEVRVTLTNPTSFPLTLVSVRITLRLGTDTDFHLICKDRLLAPDERVEIPARVALNREHVPIFIGERLGLVVTGETKFKSIMGKIETLPIQGILICGHEKTTFSYTVPSDPNKETDD